MARDRAALSPYRNPPLPVRPVFLGAAGFAFTLNGVLREYGNRGILSVQQKRGKQNGNLPQLFRSNTRRRWSQPLRTVPLLQAQGQAQRPAQAQEVTSQPRGNRPGAPALKGHGNAAKPQIQPTRARTTRTRKQRENSRQEPRPHEKRLQRMQLLRRRPRARLQQGKEMMIIIEWSDVGFWAGEAALLITAISLIGYALKKKAK